MRGPALIHESYVHFPVRGSAKKFRPDLAGRNFLARGPSQPPVPFSDHSEIPDVPRIRPNSRETRSQFGQNRENSGPSPESSPKSRTISAKLACWRRTKVRLQQLKTKPAYWFQILKITFFVRFSKFGTSRLVWKSAAKSLILQRFCSREIRYKANFALWNRHGVGPNLNLN